MTTPNETKPQPENIAVPLALKHAVPKRSRWSLFLSTSLVIATWGYVLYQLHALDKVMDVLRIPTSSDIKQLTTIDVDQLLLTSAGKVTFLHVYASW